MRTQRTREAVTSISNFTSSMRRCHHDESQLSSHSYSTLPAPGVHSCTHPASVHERQPSGVRDSQKSVLDCSCGG